MITWLRAVFCTVVASLSLPANAADHSAAARPNVLLILADDLGIGDVSCFNARSIWQTPNLDRLAKEGLMLTDAHSASALCTPTRYSLLTGRYSWRGRLKSGVLQGYSPPLIETGRLTLPAFLRQNGYHTAMFGKWHLGLEWTRTGEQPDAVDFTQPVGGGPTAIGFERFFGISASLDMPPYVWINDDRITAVPTSRVGDSAAPKLWRAGPIGPDFQMAEVQPTLVGKTLSYLEEHTKRGAEHPFFVYLALAAPHTPTLPTKDFAGRTPTPYGDFVLQIDADVGRILQALDRYNLARNTLVIFTSDNGFAPAADIPHHRDFGHDPSGGYRGVKSDSFEGGHRIPFIARWPAVIAAGQRRNETVAQFDLFATCAEILGQRLPDNAAEDSVSFLPLLRGEHNVTRPPVVHHSAAGEFSIREGRWKLILAPGSGGWSYPTKMPSPWTQPKADSFDGLPPFQLYDVEQDPAEKTNVAAAHDDVVQRLGRLLRTYVERGRSTPGAAQANNPALWPQLSWMGKFAP